MQPDTTGAASAAPEPTPEPSPAFESTVLTLLEQMQAGLATLSARVDQIEDGRPRFAQPLPEEVEPVHSFEDDQRKMRAEIPPDGQARMNKIPVFSDGLQVHDLIMQQFQPRFREGQRVRRNLDAVPMDRADGRTLRDLKIEDGTPDGIGEVISVQFLSKQQGRGWKYRCKFPSKTAPGSNGGVISLYERELVPA